MEGPEKQTYVCDSEAEAYRKKIVEMVGQIENKRFLKAIYISVSEYLKENEPD